MLDVGKWSIFHLVDDTVLSSAQLLSVFGTNGNEAFILTNNDEVFALGTNVNYCLGLASCQSTLKVKKVDKLSKINIVTFSFGRTPHVLALTGSYLLSFYSIVILHYLKLA